MRSASSPRSLAQTMRDKSRHGGHVTPSAGAHRSPSHQPPTPPSMVPGPKDFLAMHQERLQFEAQQAKELESLHQQEPNRYAYLVENNSKHIYHTIQSYKKKKDKIYKKGPK